MDARKYLAELIGTFILVFVGSMSILAATKVDAPIILVVPFGFGLGLLAAIHAAGHVSGGHFNPAVTLGALLDRRISAADAAAYAVAQVVGAIAASLVVFALSSQSSVASTANAVGQDVSMLQAIVVETILTAIFLVVILTITRRAVDQAAFTIPLTLIAIHFAGIPFSGASVNPARSIGPALVGGALDSTIIVYIVGPLLGAVIGWAIYRALDEVP